jgi:hypothetical protein
MYDNDTRLDMEARDQQRNLEKGQRMKNKVVRRPNKIQIGDWSWIPTKIEYGVNGYVEVKAIDEKEADKKCYILGNGFLMYNYRDPFKEVKTGVWRAKTYGHI